MRTHQVAKPGLADELDCCWAYVHSASMPWDARKQWRNCRQRRRAEKLTCGRHFYLEDKARALQAALKQQEDTHGNA